MGEKAGRILCRRLKAREPVEEELASHLVPLLGLFGGSLSVQAVTPQARANAYVVEQFLPVRFHIREHEIRCAVS